MIHGFEIATLALLGALFFQITRLSAKERAPARATVSSYVDDAIYVEPETKNRKQEPKSSYSQNMESVKQAQAFSGSQLLEVSRDFIDLNKEMPEWLCEAIALYLIGAVDFIGRQGKCEATKRREMIRLVLKSNLRIDAGQAEALFMEAVCREPGSDNDNIVLAGAAAAKSWLLDNTVPEEKGLVAQLENWGVFA